MYNEINVSRPCAETLSCAVPQVLLVNRRPTTASPAGVKLICATVSMASKY